MLTRKERLRYSGLFQQAFEKGKTISSQNLRVTTTKTRDYCKNQLPLVGFSISKAYSKRAVDRNLIKRRLREIYRLYRMNPIHIEKLNALGLLVIGLKKSTTVESITSKKYNDLKTELESLLSSCVR